MKTALVGDIGGTNARFALWRDQRIEQIRVLPTADHARPELAIRAYLDEVGQPLGALEAVCLACAGPVGGDHFRFTNNHWQLSRQAFCRELGLKDLLLINDFTAMALGMTRLRDDERVTVREGEPEPGRPRLVIGPGTGLGLPGCCRWWAAAGARCRARAGISVCRSAASARRRSGRNCTAHRAT